MNVVCVIIVAWYCNLNVIKKKQKSCDAKLSDRS